MHERFVISQKMLKMIKNIGEFEIEGLISTEKPKKRMPNITNICRFGVISGDPFQFLTFFSFKSMLVFFLSVQRGFCFLHFIVCMCVCVSVICACAYVWYVKYEYIKISIYDMYKKKDEKALTPTQDQTHKIIFVLFCFAYFFILCFEKNE